MALKAGRPSGRTREHIAADTAQLEENKRLHVILPASEYKQLRLYALEHDTTVSEIVRKAIQKVIRKR